MKKIIVAMMLVVLFSTLLSAAIGEALKPVGYRTATSLFGGTKWYVTYQHSNGETLDIEVDKVVYDEVVESLAVENWKHERKRWYLPWTWFDK